jgi:hypothetical protein
MEHVCGDQLGLGLVEEHIDFVVTRLQRFLGRVGKVAAVDGAERLPALGGAWDGDQRRAGSSAGDQESQQLRRHPGEVYGEDHIQFGLRGTEGGVDSAEGTAVGVDIFDHRGQGCVFLGTADDVHLLGDGAGQVEGSGEQRAAVEGEEGFVGAHAGAAASGEDKGGNSRRGGGHGVMIQDWLKRLGVGVGSLNPHFWQNRTEVGHPEWVPEIP